MKITFGAFFRTTPATIMRCGPTFRLARTHPARARSSGSETLSRSRSLVGYTIDTHESEVFGSHRIFGAHPADQRAQFPIDLRSASKRAGFPTPVPTEAGSMPTYESLRSDDRDGLEDRWKPSI